MELKLSIVCNETESDVCLNRTFYGIETHDCFFGTAVPVSLNRTFYGIETTNLRQLIRHLQVLIVPFMELKPSKRLPLL